MNDNFSFNIVILAAGLGTRLKAVSGAHSKAMTPLGEEVLIARALRAAIDSNPSQVVAAIREEDFEAKGFLVSKGFNEDKKSRLSLSVKSTSSPVATLSCAFEKLSTQLPTVIFTVDSWFDPSDFKRFLEAFSKTEADVLMGVTSWLEDEKPLLLVCDSEMEVKAFADNPAEYVGNDSCFVSAGIYAVSSKALPYAIDACGQNKGKLRQWQRELLEKGLKVKAFLFGRVFDIDRPEDFEKALSLNGSIS